MSRRYDFHCHSTASDGTLTPTELVQRAAGQGVELLALTDHDTLAGLEEARAAAQTAGIQLVNGIELSVVWQNRELHMVALGFDHQHEAITGLVDRQQQAREKRARIMGQRLDKAVPMTGAYDRAAALSGQSAPGRPWFARVLLEAGHVRSMDHAFNRFLKQGQSGFVRTPWVAMEDAVAAVAEAGGMSVIAHPVSYGLTRTKLRRLLADFVACGGDGLEVAVPGLHPNQQRLMAECLTDFPLSASGGSDFHSPAQTWLELGRVPELPADARPIWAALAA